MIARGVFVPNWTRRCIDGDSEELDEGQTSRFQILSAYSVVSQQRKNGRSKDGTVDVYEVEKSDNVGDETLEAATEICQGHRGHVNSV